jgi:hypothetical protein
MPAAPAHSAARLLPLLPVADVKKAKEGGFYTIQSLIMNPRKVNHSLYL